MVIGSSPIWSIIVYKEVRYDMGFPIILIGFAILSMCCQALQKVMLFSEWILKAPLVVLLSAGVICSIAMIVYGIANFIREIYLTIYSLKHKD